MVLPYMYRLTFLGGGQAADHTTYPIYPLVDPMELFCLNHKNATVCPLMRAIPTGRRSL
jgi:hypothetical protein